MADGDDAEQVVHLPLEPAGRKREVGQRGDLRSSAIDLDHQLDPAVGRTGGEEVGDTHRSEARRRRPRGPGEIPAAEAPAAAACRRVGRHLDGLAEAPRAARGSTTGPSDSVMAPRSWRPHGAEVGEARPRRR